MNGTFEDLVNELKNKNIRLSHQRLKVLEYINNNKTHPTVDEIYKDLQKEIPTLSKTTIYNTLNALADSNLVKVLTIEDNEARYDGNTNDHGHFKCTSCKKIFDFDIDFDSMAIAGLNNFKIHNKDMYFKGLCSSCNKTM
ncbi:Fur family transcriptional regulator [Tissierella sp. MB52-C2]|uniref:Fur family transcriptional regulator n=1 Tax=Tissierella sp. MB52-C2 TaxID=3070999 RepID=UPI00280B9829|nr:Fur family transcriptional regulator [Tissierella sp. MB52-C2]WMM24968.1 Fur family transcriptional regulator [Tissierella sp. MB52-C2]